MNEGIWFKDSFVLTPGDRVGSYLIGGDAFTATK